MNALVINVSQIKELFLFVENIGPTKHFILFVAFIVLFFFVNIWFFIKLNALRKMSKRFMANSKRENFEGGLKLVRNVRCLFALIILLDVLIFYFHSYNLSHYLKINVIYVFIVLLVIFVVHMRLGIPVVLNGRKAETLFKNLYHTVPKVEVIKNTGRQNEEDFFEAAETQKQTEVIASDTPKKETAPQDTDEIIEFDDEGYIGAWKPKKNDTDISEEKEREEEVKTKECPFCGTLNGINNGVCDFCGADIPEQGE